MDIPRRCLSSMCPRCLDSYKELNPQLEMPIKLVVYYFSVRIHHLSAWVDQGTGLLHPEHVLIIYLTAYYRAIWYTTHRLLPFYQNLPSTLLHVLHVRPCLQAASRTKSPTPMHQCIACKMVQRLSPALLNKISRTKLPPSVQGLSQRRPPVSKAAPCNLLMFPLQPASARPPGQHWHTTLLISTAETHKAQANRRMQMDRYATIKVIAPLQMIGRNPQ